MNLFYDYMKVYKKQIPYTQANLFAATYTALLLKYNPIYTEELSVYINARANILCDGLVAYFAFQLVNFLLYNTEQTVTFSIEDLHRYPATEHYRLLSAVEDLQTHRLEEKHLKAANDLKPIFDSTQILRRPDSLEPLYFYVYIPLMFIAKVFSSAYVLGLIYSDITRISTAHLIVNSINITLSLLKAMPLVASLYIICANRLPDFIGRDDKIRTHQRILCRWMTNTHANGMPSELAEVRDIVHDTLP